MFIEADHGSVPGMTGVEHWSTAGQIRLVTWGHMTDSYQSVFTQSLGFLNLFLKDQYRNIFCRWQSGGLHPPQGTQIFLYFVGLSIYRENEKNVVFFVLFCFCFVFFQNECVLNELLLQEESLGGAA